MADSPKGLDRLLRQMAALPDSVRRELSAVLEGGAAEMAGAVRRAASFDARLARSVNYCAGPAPGTAVLKSNEGDSDRVRIKGEAGLYYTVYAGDKDAFYARWTENGTAPHALVQGADISRNKRQFGVWHPGSQANPFFWPTIRVHRGRQRSKVIRAGRKAAQALVRVS